MPVLASSAMTWPSSVVEQDLALGVVDAAVDEVAAGDRDRPLVLLRGVLPLDRRAFLASGRGRRRGWGTPSARTSSCRRPAAAPSWPRRAPVENDPGLLELLDVPGGDLAQRAVARRTSSSCPGWPTGRRRSGATSAPGWRPPPRAAAGQPQMPTGSHASLRPLLHLRNRDSPPPLRSGRERPRGSSSALLIRAHLRVHLDLDELRGFPRHGRPHLLPARSRLTGLEGF